MKKRLWGIIPIILLVFLFFQPLLYAQSMGPGMMGQAAEPEHNEQQQGSNWNYCPYCGSYLGPRGGYGMGPGMMGPGYGMGYGMMGPGMMGPGYGMGYGMMGPGMMSPGYGMGYGMGPGMMGPGYGMGYGMTGPGMMGPGYGYGQQFQQHREPMDKETAKKLVENYLRSMRNPNLMLGKIESNGDNFEAEITTKTGALVDKIIIDKYTGWMRSAYSS